MQAIAAGFIALFVVVMLAQGVLLLVGHLRAPRESECLHDWVPQLAPGERGMNVYVGQEVVGYECSKCGATTRG